MNKPAARILSAFLVGTLAGCGSGGSSAPQQQRTVSVSFGIFGNVTTHLGGVQIQARLPVGVQPALEDGTSALRSPELRSAKGLVFGSYSASTRTVSIAVVDPSFNIGFGEFAVLDLAVIPGQTLSEASFTAANAPFPFFKAVGVATASNTTVSTDDLLAGKITPSLSTGFGF